MNVKKYSAIDTWNCVHHKGFYAIYGVDRGMGKDTCNVTIYAKGGKVIEMINFSHYSLYPSVDITTTADGEYAEVYISYYDKHYYREDRGEEIGCIIIVDKQGNVVKNTGFSVSDYLPFMEYVNGKYIER